MTRLINEATLPRREGTGRSYGTQGPCFLGRARWPFPYTNHLGFLPSAFSELSPQSSALASGNRISLSTWLPAHPASTGPLHPTRRRWGERGRVRRLRAPGQEKLSARAYLANSLATPEQLRVPAGYLALIAQPGPNQGTRSRQCPGVGVGDREFAW